MMERLERWLGPYAIPGLVRYVVALNALVFLLVTMSPEYAGLLELNKSAMLRGEVWRVVTWVFLPETSSIFWILFYLMFTWWVGDLLESAWGTFRLNVYYFLGMLLCICSALIFGASGGNLFLNLSLFLAVATLTPNLEILVFFVLPVKIKWVAMFSLIFPAGIVLFGPLAMKMVVLMCLGNYLAFFGPAFVRGAMDARQTQSRRRKFEEAKLPTSATLHRCAVCGATEVSRPDADFRVTADGSEYCEQHLPKRPR